MKKDFYSDSLQSVSIGKWFWFWSHKPFDTEMFNYRPTMTVVSIV